MKKLILAVFILVFGAALLACGENTGGNNTDDYLTTVTFWNIFTGPDGEEMVAMVNDFNDQFEGEYRVLTQTIPENDFYEKINTAVPLGQGPDVAIMHLNKIARYASLGLLTAYDDLDAEFNFVKEDYIAGVWDAGIYDNKRYTVPLDVHPLTLYYNKDILDNYDVSVPTTWAELITACNTLRDDSIGQWGLPMSNVWPSQLVFQSALFQNDGDDLDDKGIYPTFNTQEGFNTLEKMHDLVYEYDMSPKNVSVDEDLALFRQGKAAFHINGVWMLNGIIDSGINFGTAPIATLFGDTPATWANGHNFVMPYQSELSLDKQEAVLAFIEYVSNNSIRWANAGQIPANLSVLASDAYKELPYHQSFVDFDSIVFSSSSPYISDSFEPIYSRVTEAMSTEDVDIQALLDSAEVEGTQRVNEALDN